MNPLLLVLAMWNSEIVHPVKDAATHEMLRTLARDTDRVSRAEALAAFAFIQDPEDATWVRARLDDPIPAVRLEARRTATALAVPLPATPPPELIHESLAPPLDAALATTAAWLQGLHRQDAAAAAEQILTNLQASAVVVQEEAVRAAQRGEIVTAVPLLVPLLNDDDEGLRHTACEALAVLGPKTDHHEAVAALAARLAIEGSSLVRAAVGRALVAIHDEPAQKALEQLLADSQPVVRAAAATALGNWSVPEVALALDPLLADPETRVTVAAVEALARLHHPDTPAHFVDRVQQGPPAVQERLAWWLGEWHVAAAAAPLGQLLQPQPSATGPAHPTDPTLIHACALALGKIGATEAIPALRKLLADNRMIMVEPRLGALEALRLLQDRDSMKRVLQLLTEQVILPPPPGPSMPCYDSPEVRAEGLRFVTDFGDAALGERLLTSLKDPIDTDLRPLLAETMHTLTGKGYRPLPNQTYRRYSVESIGPSPFQSTPAAPGIGLAEPEKNAPAP